jgi:GWxTD domain-containing protein
MFRYLLIAALLFGAVDPGAQITAAKDAITAHDYDRAIDLLRSAVSDATAIVDPKQHDDALAALHFYSAVAYSAKGSDDKARDELRQFVRFKPGASKIDANRYAPQFVKLFNEVVGQPAAAGPQSFDRYYPGFDAVHSAAPKPIPIALWGTSAELRVLGKPEERTQWERLHDDHARREFIANFWVTRDPDPSTPQNEWRAVFNRRVVFADETFGSGAIRGATTDRGRVFVLLGPPARVYVTNIGRRQGGFLQVNGTQEKWVYFKPQLPPTVPQKEIDFIFLDQPAYGDHVMSREFLALHTLAEAQKALSGTR